MPKKPDPDIGLFELVEVYDADSRQECSEAGCTDLAVTLWCDQKAKVKWAGCDACMRKVFQNPDDDIAAFVAQNQKEQDADSDEVYGGEWEVIGLYNEKDQVTCSEKKCKNYAITAWHNGKVLWNGCDNCMRNEFQNPDDEIAAFKAQKEAKEQEARKINMGWKGRRCIEVVDLEKGHVLHCFDLRAGMSPFYKKYCHSIKIKDNPDRPGYHDLDEEARVRLIFEVQDMVEPAKKEGLLIQEWTYYFIEAFSRKKTESNLRNLKDDQISAIQQFALNMAHTDPSALDALWKPEKSGMLSNGHSNPWIAAVVLLGPLFVSFTQKGEKESADAAALKVTSLFRQRLATKEVQKLVKDKKVFVDRIAHIDLIANKVAALLASFDDDSEFFKEMAAVELLAIARQVTPQELAIGHITKTEMNAWDWKGDFPVISDATTEETNLLRVVWEKRNEICPLKGEKIIEARPFKRQMNFKTLLRFLRKGRQLYSDFRYMNPTLPLVSIRDILYVEFKNTFKEPELNKARREYEKKFRARKRSAAKRDEKKKEAEEGIQKLDKEAENLKQAKTEIQNNLAKAQATMTLRSSNQNQAVDDLTKKLDETTKKEEDLKKAKTDLKRKAEELAAAGLEGEDQLKIEIKVAEDGPKKKKQCKIERTSGPPSLYEVSKLGLENDLCFAPLRDHLVKHRIEYKRPGEMWKLAANRKINLLQTLYIWMQEAKDKKFISVDEGTLNAIQEEQKKKDKKELADELFKKINKRAPSNPKELMDLIPDQTKSPAICKFAKSAIVALELIDLTEFIENKKLIYRKITPKNIDASLESWFGNHHERKHLYWILTNIGIMFDTKQTAKLRKIVNAYFIKCDKEELLEMIKTMKAYKARTAEYE